MTTRPMVPRHSLLPDLRSSWAVLVGCDDGVNRTNSWNPEQMATHLAGALTAPDTAHEGTAAFRETHCQVLLSPDDPAEVVDAVRAAAAAATDTLLFYFAGRTTPHRRVPGEPPVGRNRAEGIVGSLGAVAGTIAGSAARRSVVILDGVDHRAFRMHTPTSFLLAGSSFGPPGDQLCTFTDRLVVGLSAGVHEGPELLDLLTLRTAVEADFHEARYCIEADWVVGASELIVHHPMRFRMVALGMNPAFGRSRYAGGLLRDEAAVDAAYLG